MKDRKARALFLTADEFEDMEVFFPSFRTLEEGLEVQIRTRRPGMARACFRF
jgi:hypothetical protein